jgi:hypothetical protein
MKELQGQKLKIYNKANPYRKVDRFEDIPKGSQM